MSGTFADDLDFSIAASAEPFWAAVYRKAFPDMVAHRLVPSGDPLGFKGVDREVYLRGGKRLLIDEKKLRRQHPHIALEYIANETAGTPGWMEKDLLIDYLAYAFFAPRIVHMLPWHMLRRAWVHFREQWLALALDGEWNAAGTLLLGKGGFATVRGFTQDSGHTLYTTLNCAIPIGLLRATVSRASLIDVSREIAPSQYPKVA